ncbi:rod shape-determining protein MreC [Trichlorobacter ammonificans]|uniref:Cell shape-determining protein MreC n=1 Tax=Trichlorobacter ammonificans TaxID=2916410 RepID=A0ABN8HL33_9BACT|nr:rod shape-determining protein MreC [Trichlorobacter ammonificans]CAH2030688.1 Cell shape-determining protein MreC [Trichlorobacter ammonificans]
MFNFFRKNILHIVVGVGLLAALLIYTLNLPQAGRANLVEQTVGNVLAPVQGEVSRGAALPLRIWENYLALVSVGRENQRLREDVRELNSRLAAAVEAGQENERLTALLNLRRSIREQTVTARVIGEDVTPWFKTLTIDRGMADGLRDGMPVLAAGGVVGQTVKVAADSSRVMLLTDNASGIAAVVQRSRARGVVKGKGENLCSLEFAMRGEDVQVGDQVITSGVGGIFTKGHLIGEVTMVKKGEYGVFQTVTIRPAVNISRLEEVLVVLRRSTE